MPILSTKGAMSAQGFGEFAQAKLPPVYVEDVFNTFLYTGNMQTRFIPTNDVDLLNNGGLVWMKGRSISQYHNLYDTARGATKALESDDPTGQFTQNNGLTTFLSNGFFIGNDSAINNTSSTYVSWTFRKQAKFFDVVTYSGNDSGPRSISHNLQSTPGCVIVKNFTTSQNWFVWHQSIATSNRLMFLNTTSASSEGYTSQISNVTSSSINLSNGNNINSSGSSYVMYIFASDAGGFGLSGTDNVISCGSYQGISPGSQRNVELGFEPQFILIKNATGQADWYLFDSTRGMPSLANDRYLWANSTSAEDPQGGTDFLDPTYNGFNVWGGFSALSSPNQTYIYIAIRRAPMKVPTIGTQVFIPSYDQTGQNGLVSVGFPVDTVFSKQVATSGANIWFDRLRGFYFNKALQSQTVSGETSTGITIEYGTNITGSTSNQFAMAGYGTNSGVVAYGFRRSPKFFDQVYWQANNTTLSVNHSLGVPPELIITKTRQINSLEYGNWAVGGIVTGISLNSQNPIYPTFPPPTTTTATTFRADQIISDQGYNANSINYQYFGWLFATLAGISKVGTYTGNGSERIINCGFTTGARFILIKCTSNAGGWFTYDSARGITSGNDPFFFIDSNSSQNSNTDFIAPDSSGFFITSNGVFNLNNSGRTYLFLAIA